MSRQALSIRGVRFRPATGSESDRKAWRRAHAGAAGLHYLGACNGETQERYLERVTAALLANREAYYHLLASTLEREGEQWSAPEAAAIAEYLQGAFLSYEKRDLRAMAPALVRLLFREGLIGQEVRP